MVKKGSLPNINWQSKRKPIGQILCEIAEYMGRFLVTTPTLIVRERAFTLYNRETHIIQKVVGLTDMLLWSALKKTFCELSPSEIKKYVTGNGRAEKDVVAQSLTQYIGEQKYNNNDESDACAVAIAFLLKEKYLDLPEGKEQE